MAKHGKGSVFERWFCTRLSLWWTGKERDDVFWRTAGSGGRATNRFKRGRTTAGGSGDITFTDPIGKPLLDVFTMELKRGYSKHHVTDVVDKGRAPRTQWEGFLYQAMASARQSQSLTWMIVTQRDRRLAMCWLPVTAVALLDGQGADIFSTHYCTFSTFVRPPKGRLNTMVHFMGLPLEEFWDTVSPQHIKTLRNSLRS